MLGAPSSFVNFIYMRVSIEILETNSLTYVVSYVSQAIHVKQARCKVYLKTLTLEMCIKCYEFHNCIDPLI